MRLSVERFAKNTAIYEIDPYAMAVGRVTISTALDHLNDHEFERVVLHGEIEPDPTTRRDVEAHRKR